ncbi:MAG TPA: FkbM family methyltransferase [Opitutaceae bacterium]|jgi:FkbM family methyltransferase|nr:FkbM family methyltransferase [Opitutaceae bacterium]
MNPLRYLPEAWKERLRRRAGAVTPSARLENLRRAGFDPRRIIDAGAHEGRWTRMIASIFPAAELLLIEPQPALAAGLESLCRSLPAARLRSVLLGRSSGSGLLLLEETNSRIVAPDQARGRKAVTVPMETLEGIMKETGFAPCGLLKLDLQGYELEALAGAGGMLDQVEVIMTEVSLIPIGGVPLALELSQFLAQRGFRLYDIFGHNYRPRDSALWQADFVYAREGSPLVASADWA